MIEKPPASLCSGFELHRMTALLGHGPLFAQGWVVQTMMFAAAVQRQPWKFPGIPGLEPAPALGKVDAASQSIKSPEWEKGARDTQSQ